MKFLTMPALHVGNGTHLGGLSVFPVWTTAPTVSGLDTGSTAHVQVDEREGSPVVGELVLKNLGAKPALLVAGELFEGGWQHRALNNDILLVAGQQLVASVSCVEAGRWHGATAQLRRSRRASMMVRSAQTIPDEDDRQGQVWQRVSRYDMAFGASPTASYVDHLNRRSDPEINGDSGGDVQVEQAELIAGIRKIQPLLGQRGVLIGLGGQPAFVELFASTSGLRRHLLAFSRPPPSTQQFCRPSRRRVVELAVSSGSWPWRRSAMSWARTPDPGTPWLLVRNTT
jgi:ARG and Rhodanese-Phosphatase-superfamily-associated Protein domain